MSPEEMLALWASGKSDDCRIRKGIFWGDMEGWEEAEEGEWTQDCKYQQCENVIRHTESGRCFEISASRSGSYHTDWYYSFDGDPVEVKQEERVVKSLVWVAV